MCFKHHITDAGTDSSDSDSLSFPSSIPSSVRDPWRIIVTGCDADRNSNGLVKSGLHIKCPGLLVTTDQAIIIRRQLVKHLSNSSTWTMVDEVDSTHSQAH